jgi:hypothetical protein
MPYVRKKGVAFMDRCKAVLYAKAIGAIYNGQSRVVESTKEDKYLAIILFWTSACALH